MHSNFFLKLRLIEAAEESPVIPPSASQETPYKRLRDYTEEGNNTQLQTNQTLGAVPKLLNAAMSAGAFRSLERDDIDSLESHRDYRLQIK